MKNKSPFSRKKTNFSAKKAENEAEILLHDEIGFWGIQSGDFKRALDEIEADTLHVRINSPGGAVFDGFAMYNALEQWDGKVVAHIDGLAASIASVIALGADEIVMGEGAYFMIHDPWTIEVGDADAMRKAAGLLDKLGGSIAAIYAKRTGASLDEIEQLMADETWFDADEAIEIGLANRKEPGAGAKAQVFDLSMYAKVPAALRADNQNDVPSKRDLERLLTRDAGLSRSQAAAFVRDGYHALSGTRDAAEEADNLLQALQTALSIIYNP